MEPIKKDPSDFRYNLYQPIYRQHSDGAGYFYSNIKTKEVKVFGFIGRYQQGTSSKTKREFWYINEPDANTDALPTEGMAVVDGPAITNEQWAELKSTQLGTAPPQSVDAQPIATHQPVAETPPTTEAPF